EAEWWEPLAAISGKCKAVQPDENCKYSKRLGEYVSARDAKRAEIASLEKGSAEKPFIYAIEDSKGNWKDGEQCVFGDAASAKDEVELLNDAFPEGDIEYKVVTL